MVCIQSFIQLQFSYREFLRLAWHQQASQQQVSVLSTLFQFHHLGHRGLFIMWESTGWVTGWGFADGHVRVTSVLLLLELISQLKTCWSKQSQVFVSIFVSIGPIWPPTQTHLVRNDEIFLGGFISRGDSVQNTLGIIWGCRTGWELLKLFMNQMKSCQTPSPAFAREIQHFSQVSFYFSSTASWIKSLEFILICLLLMKYELEIL